VKPGALARVLTFVISRFRACTIKDQDINEVEPTLSAAHTGLGSCTSLTQHLRAGLSICRAYGALGFASLAQFPTALYVPVLPVRSLSLVTKRKFIVPSECGWGVVDSTHGYEYVSRRSRNDFQPQVAISGPECQIGIGLCCGIPFFLRFCSGVRPIWAYLRF
jgi:hypothetical protein